jgi:serine/threonine protein kinase
VQNGTYSFSSEIWSSRSDNAKDLIKQLMERDVDKRLSATQALQHSWLQTKVPNQFDENMAKKALNNLT